MHRLARRTLKVFFAVLAAAWMTMPVLTPHAEDFVDLTLTFEGAVHGEIAPCG